MNVENIYEESEAFDNRIKERVENGFIPDIRNYKKCNYFYKSFWRDPHFVNLYLGNMIRTFIEYINKHIKSEYKKVLDVGCGSGYVSLELYRQGYNVTGIDISEKCIEIAKNTFENNCMENFTGKLKYVCESFEKFDDINQYDVILFSGALHHFKDIDSVLNKTRKLLKDTGVIVCYEPCHELWDVKDAAQVALIRSLLSLTGNWYEKDLGENIKEEQDFYKYTNDVLLEYKEERDKDEVGQSPNDNSCNGEEILKALKEKYVQLEYKRGFSYIYRLLGGIRGNDELIYKIADLLYNYENICVENKFMNPNGFYFVGKKEV